MFCHLVFLLTVFLSTISLSFYMAETDSARCLGETQALMERKEKGKDKKKKGFKKKRGKCVNVMISMIFQLPTPASPRALCQIET